ncbi:MAG TPA: vanadium-dependent haloperoxidase [Anaeromyxobacteraceae bacterium]|nr:vanadium-dependent haloperoxidase [Anaeromyxobacteraceae bacterium]
MTRMKPVRLLAGALLLSSGAAYPGAAPALSPRPQAWFAGPSAAIECPPPDEAKRAAAEAKRLAAKRGEAEAARLRWWSAGGPAYRWNELTIQAFLDDFVTLPLAARHLALVHAAIDDAVAAALAARRSTGKAPACRPSEYAAAATAAAEVLGYVLPARAQSFAGLAEEAIQARLKAGAEPASDAAAGRALGRQVAALAIARGKSDRSDAKWTGTVPEGPGSWKGTNPVAPMTGTWQPWAMASPDEFRPPPPPAHDSDAAKAALAEVKAFQRTPKSNHRANYWEVFGGPRAYALWNETARLKLLEYGDRFDAAASARLLAALNVALVDSAIACWDAKYQYWYIRPSQLDPELKPVFTPPNHPSYPSAHGCISTAAAEVLAAAFPADRERLLAMGNEAAEARIWAGIHYRFDIDVGQSMGRQVAAKVLGRAFADAPQTVGSAR